MIQCADMSVSRSGCVGEVSRVGCFLFEFMSIRALSSGVNLRRHLFCMHRGGLHGSTSSCIFVLFQIQLYLLPMKVLASVSGHVELEKFTFHSTPGDCSGGKVFLATST